MTRQNEPIEATMEPEPLVDLHAFAAGIRWRRRIWVTLALVGLLAGVAAATATPSRSTASAKVYVVHGDGAGGDGAMETDLALLETTSVAADAVRRLQLAVSPERFVGTYSGEVIADGILQVDARGDDPAEAVARARAVADAFMAVHVQQSVDAATGQEEGQAGSGAPAVAAGTKIIDGPRDTSGSVLVTGALYGAIGLLLGLGLGIALAAVATVVRDRPVLRRDIAAQLGASVIAQLPAPIRGPRRLVRRSRPVQERKAAAATLVRAVRAGSGPVSVLELGCAAAAAALAHDMAEELAIDGPVVLVDDLPGDELSRLSTPSEAGGLVVVPGAEFVPDRQADARTQRIGVGTVRPGTPWTDLRRLGIETLLVVRAGSAEASWLHTVARQLADARIAVIGVVLVHPDPRDRSDGTLWDALHTAVRGRIAAAPRPTPRPAPVQAAGRALLAIAGAETTQRLPVAVGDGRPNGSGGTRNGLDSRTDQLRATRTQLDSEENR